MEQDLRGLQRQWKAAFCAPGQEFKVRDKVEAKHIDVFLPYYWEQKKNSQGKQTPRRMAYFPRYLFVYITEDEEYIVNAVNGMCYMLGGAVDELIMGEMQRVAMKDGEVIIARKQKKRRWRPGQRLKVADKTSPFYSMELSLLSISNSGLLKAMPVHCSKNTIILPISKVEEMTQESNNTSKTE